MGKVSVPKTGQKPPSPRRDASGDLWGWVAVPKTGQKPPLPREDAPEVPVGRVTVPKTVQKPPSPRDNLYPMCASRFPCAREQTPLGIFPCLMPSIFMKFTWHLLGS